MPIAPDRVRGALETIRSRVVRTPLLESPLLNELVRSRRGMADTRVFVKAECLQHTGAFKFRGALHKLLCMDDETRGRGVCAFSSGNFAQALALAARETGVQCTIIAPHDAPAVKMERTRGYGAEVIFSTPAAGENREVAAAALAERFSATSGRRPLPTTGLNPHLISYSGGVVLGRALLHPFDDEDVILGQGTLALELFEQHAEAGEAGAAGGAGGGRVAPLSRLLVPTGGGGMAGGCCLARDAASPKTQVWAIEPEGYDDHRTSLARGERTALSGTLA